MGFLYTCAALNNMLTDTMIVEPPVLYSREVVVVVTTI